MAVEAFDIMTVAFPAVKPLLPVIRQQALSTDGESMLIVPVLIAVFPEFNAPIEPPAVTVTAFGATLIVTGKITSNFAAEEE